MVRGGGLVDVKRNIITWLIISGALLIGFAAYSLWNQSEKAQSQNKLPAFTLMDVEGHSFNLYNRQVKPIIIHFMAISCGGEFSAINANQMQELVKLKEALGDQAEIVTVVVTTCTTTDLVEFKNYFNVTWTFGNDYADNKLDILEAFRDFKLTDGAIIIGTSQNGFQEMIREEVDASTLRQKLGL